MKMRNLAKCCSLMLFATVLASCSSTRIDSGQIKARTFSFVQTQSRPAPEFAENRAPIHALTQGAISRSLAQRQISRVEQGGDITVAYLIVAGNNAVTTSINDYFGYGRDSAKLAEIAHAQYTGNKNPNYFEAGTLLIDLIDSKSLKVLYRGYATRALRPDATAESQSARMSEVVEEILSKARFE